MSVRQRIPFRFSEGAVEEDERVLDEQEQEELINDLKERSKLQNNLYRAWLQAVLSFSGLLHLIYLFGNSTEPPTVSIFPYYLPPRGFVPLPGYHFFTMLHLFIHLNLGGQLLPLSHPVRRWLTRQHASPYTLFLPLPFLVVLPLSVFAPVLSLIVSNGWHDFVWWTETAALAWFISSSQRWMNEESESLRTLEGLRYDARGA